MSLAAAPVHRPGRVYLAVGAYLATPAHACLCGQLWPCPAAVAGAARVILAGARALLADPTSWGQPPTAKRIAEKAWNRRGTLVRDTEERGQKATRRSAAGAFERAVREATGDADGVAIDAAYGYLVDACGIERGLAEWNADPSRTHADVLAAFDAAIRAAEAACR